MRMRTVINANIYCGASRGCAYEWKSCRRKCLVYETTMMNNGPWVPPQSPRKCVPLPNGIFVLFSTDHVLLHKCYGYPYTLNALRTLTVFNIDSYYRVMWTFLSCTSCYAHALNNRKYWLKWKIWHKQNYYNDPRKRCLNVIHKGIVR